MRRTFLKNRFQAPDPTMSFPEHAHGSGATVPGTNEEVYSISKAKMYASGVLLAAAGASLGYGFASGALTGNKPAEQAVAVAVPALLAAGGWYGIMTSYQDPTVAANLGG